MPINPTATRTTGAMNFGANGAALAAMDTTASLSALNAVARNVQSSALHDQAEAVKLNAADALAVKQVFTEISNKTREGIRAIAF